MLINYKWPITWSYPCSDVTYLLKHPTNALINVNTTLFTPLHSYIFQPSRGHPQGVLIHFVSRVISQQNTCPNEYILITNLMHQLLFIHKIIFSSTCFVPQVLIFRRIQLYTCSVWQCHSLRDFLVACWYTAWVRTDWKGKVVGGCLNTTTNNLPLPVSSHSSCVPTGHQERP